jgi:hypothetical protein
VAGSVLQRRPDVGDRAAGALLGLSLGIHLEADPDASARLATLEHAAEVAARGGHDLDVLAEHGATPPVLVPLALAHLGDEEGLVRAVRDLAVARHLDGVVAEELVAWSVAVQRAVRDARPDTRLERLAGHRHDAGASDLVRLVTRAAGRGDPVVGAPQIGALAGGRWGASAVPFSWRRALDRHAPRLTGRLVRLAMRAANGGAPVEESWPMVPMLAGPRLGQAPFLHELAEDPGVVLGNRAALPAAVAEVDAVVSLCLVDADEVPGHLEHHEVVLVDRADAAANPNLSLVLADTAEAITTLRAEGKRVFVHCLAGRSRMPTVVAAYLARRAGLPGPEAFARVAAQVPHPDPLNRAFQQALAWIGPERDAREPQRPRGD